MKDLLDQKENSHMQQHVADTHPELKGTFTTPDQVAETFELKVIRKHTSSLNRQLHEAIRIRRAGDQTLNTKEEYSPQEYKAPNTELEGAQQNPCTQKHREPEQVTLEPVGPDNKPGTQECEIPNTELEGAQLNPCTLEHREP